MFNALPYLGKHRRVLVQRVLTSAFLIIAGTMYIFLKEMRDGEVTARDTTMCFTTFVCFDMFNALSCRSADKSIFQIGFLSNKMFLWAVCFYICFPRLRFFSLVASLWFSLACSAQGCPLLTDFLKETYNLFITGGRLPVRAAPGHLLPAAARGFPDRGSLFNRHPVHNRAHLVRILGR